MKKFDYAMHILFIVVLLVLSIFWGCRYDLLITILGLIIALASGIATFYQYKKIKELHDKNGDKAKE